MVRVWQTLRALIGASLPLLLSAACTLAPSHSIKIQLPDLSQNAGQILNAQLAPGMHAEGTSTINSAGRSLPETLTDFNCLAVMVTADDIAANSDLVNGCGYVAGSSSMPSSPGIVAGFVPITGGEIDLQVPAGKSRLFQLLAFQTAPGFGCPSVNELLSCDLDPSSTDPVCVFEHAVQGGPAVGEPMEVGRTTADILSDTSVSIQAAYDPGNPAVAFTCSNDSSGGSGGGPTPLPLLFLEGTIGGMSSTEWQDSGSIASDSLLANFSSSPAYSAFSCSNTSSFILLGMVPGNTTPVGINYSSSTNPYMALNMIFTAPYGTDPSQFSSISVTVNGVEGGGSTGGTQPPTMSANHPGVDFNVYNFTTNAWSSSPVSGGGAAPQTITWSMPATDTVSDYLQTSAGIPGTSLNSACSTTPFAASLSQPYLLVSLRVPTSFNSISPDTSVAITLQDIEAQLVP